MATVLTDGPPHPALRATFSHGGEKGSRLRTFGSIAFSPPWEKVAKPDEGGSQL
jgi:hypothetical protein